MLKFTNNEIYQQSKHKRMCTQIVLRWFSIKFKLNNSIFPRVLKLNPRFNLSAKNCRIFNDPMIGEADKSLMIDENGVLRHTFSRNEISVRWRVYGGCRPLYRHAIKLVSFTKPEFDLWCLTRDISR